MFVPTTLRRAALAACALLAPSLAAAQAAPAAPAAPALRELSTDRPDRTESPHTVPAGRMQVELDLVSYTRDRVREGGADLLSQGLGVGAANLKLGLHRSVDLQLVAESYTATRVEDATGGLVSRRRGPGVFAVRSKVSLWGNDGGRTALAVMPFVAFEEGENGREVNGGLIVPLAVELAGGWGLGTMVEVDAARDAAGDAYDLSWIASVVLGRDLTDRLGGFVELYGERSGPGAAGRIATLDGGLTYGLTPDVQLDGGVNVGLTAAAEDLHPFLGLSVRF